MYNQLKSTELESIEIPLERLQRSIPNQNHQIIYNSVALATVLYGLKQMCEVCFWWPVVNGGHMVVT